MLVVTGFKDFEISICFFSNPAWKVMLLKHPPNLQVVQAISTLPAAHGDVLWWQTCKSPSCNGAYNSHKID